MPAHGAHPWAPAQRGEAVPRLIRFAPALLAECGPAPTRASMPSVAARPRSLCSLRLRVAATRLARSNKGALLPHSAAMLGVLYGAWSHLARAFGNCSCVALPPASMHPPCATRSEERRVGKEWVRPC